METVRFGAGSVGIVLVSLVLVGAQFVTGSAALA
jgi:hypothetical protein